MCSKASDATVVDIRDDQALHAMALAIADHAARSEIELYACQCVDADGRRVFDMAQPREETVDEQSFALVAIAVRYIELRGAALPYRLHRSGTCVWFDTGLAPSRVDQISG